MIKSNITLTGAGGSKLAFLGFTDVTCSIGRFMFTEEFAVIKGMVLDMLLGIRWEHKFNIHTGWTQNGNHYIAHGKHNFISESINRLKMHPIIKTKGKIMLKPESISSIEVQALMDILGNRRYQPNPEAYLPQGIIPLDLVHSFEKTPRTLKLPFLNTSTNYESIPRGSLLSTFEPVDEEINKKHTTSWTKLKGQMCQAHSTEKKEKLQMSPAEIFQGGEGITQIAAGLSD